MNNKKNAAVFSGLFSVMCITMMLLAAGCGGRSSGGVSDNYTGEIITGTVSAPSGVSLSRAAGVEEVVVTSGASVTSTAAVPGASIEVYYIDANGDKTGGTIASITADASGAFSLELPYGVTLPAPGLIASTGTGSNLMRAFITENSTDINLYSEHAVYNLLREGISLTSISRSDTVYYDYMGRRNFENLGATGETTVSGYITLLNPIVLFSSGENCRGDVDVNVEYIKSNALSGATCEKCCLSGADLSDTYMPGANLSGAYMKDADLSGSEMSRSNLTEANLTGAKLEITNLDNADLLNADMSGADMSGVYLNYAKLISANLAGATMNYAELKYADMTGAILEGTNLSFAILDGATWTDGTTTCADGSNIGICVGFSGDVIHNDGTVD